MSDQNTRNEDARRAVLAYLAVRQAIAQAAATIRRRVNHEGFDFAQSEIDSALTFLVSAELVTEKHSSFGASVHYQATSKGVLAYERGD